MANEGSTHAVTGATLKMFIHSQILWGFEVTPPVISRFQNVFLSVHSTWQLWRAVEGNAASEEEEEKGVKLLSVSTEPSSPGRGSKLLQKDKDESGKFDEEETEEKYQYANLQEI